MQRCGSTFSGTATSPTTSQPPTWIFSLHLQFKKARSLRNSCRELHFGAVLLPPAGGEKLGTLHSKRTGGARFNMPEVLLFCCSYLFNYFTLFCKHTLSCHHPQSAIHRQRFHTKSCEKKNNTQLHLCPKVQLFFVSLTSSPDFL